jgi:hypothetical protein
MALLTQKDISGHSSLHYLEKIDAYKMLQTNIIDYVMAEIMSGVPISGAFKDDSTLWAIYQASQQGKLADEEIENRFLGKRRNTSGRVHSFCFHSYVRSIELKVMFDTLQMIVLAIIYQYFIVEYLAKDLNFVEQAYSN